MESLQMALQSKEGRANLIGMILGIIVTCGGGYLLRDNTIACDIVVIAGSLFSMVGVERFCRLIVSFQNKSDSE